jgi:hypothetical protein
VIRALLPLAALLAAPASAQDEPSRIVPTKRTPEVVAGVLKPASAQQQLVDAAITVKGAGAVRWNGQGCTATIVGVHAVCRRKLFKGEKVTFAAVPGAGQAFAGWKGACAGTTAACTIAPRGNVKVVASFAATR